MADRKRLSGTMPTELYNRLSDYCASVGVPVSYGICFIVDNYLNAVAIQKLSEQTVQLHDETKVATDAIDQIKKAMNIRE